MIRILVRALPVLAVALLVGCSGTNTGAVQATPDLARETLKRGLEAWKNGKDAPTIQATESIIFSDTDLESGAKLHNYEVHGDGQADGFDWQMRVTLSLEDRSGKKSEKKAIYNINTTPKRVIVRKEM